MPDRKLDSTSRRLELSDVCSEISDRVANPSESEHDRFVGLEHMETGESKLRKFGRTADLVSSMKLFKKGDVLVARRNVYLKRAAVADFDGVCSGDAIVLRPKVDERFLPGIIPFLLNTERFWEYAIKHAAGTMSKRLSVENLLKYEFALPLIGEQSRLVDLLTVIGQVTEALENARNDAQTLLRSLSMDQFSKGGDDPQNLSTHYSVVSGQVDPKDSNYSGLPLIAPNHIESGTGRIIGIESASQQSAISGKYLFDQGAVIYSKIRPNLVKAAIAPCRGLCSADMYALITKESLRNEYLLEILLSEHFTQFAVSGSMRTGIPKLNREHLAQYKCVVPDLEKQDEYLSRVRAIREVEANLIQRRNAARRLKDQIISEGMGV